MAIVDTLHPAEFWDVGAQIGYYGLLVLSNSPGTIVRLYEPDPTNIELLRATLATTLTGAATAAQVALSDTQGHSPFFLDPSTRARGTLSRLEAVTSESIIVETTTLDSEVAGRGSHPTLLKLDVEGQEEAVLSGGQEALERHHPIVIYECFHGGAGRLMAGYEQLDAETLRSPTARTTNYLALPLDVIALLPRLSAVRDGYMRDWL